MSNIGDIQKSMSGAQASPYGGAPTVAQLFDETLFFNKAADDGAAATATADTLFWTNPFDFPVQIVSARYTPTTGGITADNTNFATIALKSNDGAGGATATGLSITTAITDSGNLSQNQSKAFTLATAAGQTIPAGGGLWLNIAKSGTGVVVRAGILTVRLRRGEFSGA
jgi:hypothetical protein